MLTTAEGIIIHTFKYGDTSAIAKIFTPQYGLISLIFKGVYRKGRAKGALQPLHLVQFSFYKKDNKSLFTGKEISITTPYKSIQTHLLKNTIGIFLAEFLQKILKTEESEQETYTFIKDGLLSFDEEEFNPLFHLWFLSNYLKFAGFLPSFQEMSTHSALSLIEGTFASSYDLAPHDTMEGEALELFKQITAASAQELNRVYSNYRIRQELLEKLLVYYRIHLPEMGEMNAHKILHDILQ